MPKLVFLNKDFAGKDFELILEKTTVGRAPDNTLVIHDNSVSAHHCEILVHGPEVIVRDNASKNGTFVEGMRVSPQAPVKSGQLVRFGEIESRLVVEVNRPRRTDTEITTLYTKDEVEREQRREAKKEKLPSHGELGTGSGDKEHTVFLAKKKAETPTGSAEDEEVVQSRTHEPLYILPEPKSAARRWLVIALVVGLVMIAVAFYFLRR